MHSFNNRIFWSLLMAGMLFCNVKTFGQCTTTISTFPYVEDFEASNGGWTSGGTLSDWAWGAPAKAAISTAGSGSKCWISGGLTGTFYNYSERSYVQSPCFDFTNLQHPFIAFLLYRESEWKFDGSNLQYSLDQGTTWKNLGAFGDAVDCMNANWYNYGNITYLTAPLSPVNDGWCGNSIANSTEGGTACQGGNGSLGWVRAKHCMQNLAGKPSVKFRFTFGAGTTCNHFQGIAFDSISISEAPANTGSFTYTCTNAHTVSFTGTAGLACTDTYTWNFGDPSSGAANTAVTPTPTHTFSNSGHYTVSLTISGGPCNAPATITKTIDILSIITTVQSVSCFNGNNGAINVTPSGGTAPYSYSWTGGLTTQNLTGLTAGSYTVTVSDPQSCPATATATVNQPNVLAGTTTVTGAGCSGGSNGSITVTPSGGTGPFTYNWGGGVTSNPRAGLAAGSYTVTITDSKGCTATASGTITQSSAIVGTGVTTNTTCGGSSGTITLTVTNGTSPYSFLWSNAATTQNLTGLAGGTYTVIITDAQGCSATASATVGQTGAPTLTATPVQITCNNDNDGQVTTIINGGTPNYVYSWSNAQSTPNITNLAAGTYTVTVHDAQNCSVTASATIVNPAPVVVVLTPQNEACFGDATAAITSAVTGGTPNYTYLWTNSATTANLPGLTIGTYTVTVTDQNTCTGIATATISQPVQLTASATSTNASCFGQANGTVTLTVNGGTTPDVFLWSNGSTTQNLTNVTGTVTYSVVVTDANQCTVTASAIVNAPTQILVTGTPSPASCFGYTNGSITTNETGGTPGYTYLWSNNAVAQNLNNIANGTYTITVTDASGCTASSSFVVTAPQAITVANTPTEVSCFGGNNGALALTTSGGSGGGYTFLWSDGTTAAGLSNLVAGNYGVIITDGNSCTQSATFTITQPTDVTLDTTSTPQSCASKSDGTATVSATGGTPPFSYNWSNTGNTASISNLIAGNYLVTVTDAHLCAYTSSVTVGILGAMQYTDTTVQPICPPITTGIISVLNVTGGTPPYTYTWNGQPGSSTLTNLAAGIYTLVVSDSKGCSLPTDTFDLHYLYTVTVTAGPGSTIELGNSTELTSTSNTATGLSYNWSPVEGLDCSTCENTGAQPVRTMWFYVAVQDSNGCQANDSVLITVIPNYDLYIPNAFTPNGDGNNDYFQVFGNKKAIIFWQIEVFNRWGEKVFQSNDINFGWDGTYKGRLQNPGVFVYEAKVVFLDDHTRNNLKGSLTLIR